MPVDIQENTKVDFDHVRLCEGSGRISSLRYAVALDPVDNEIPSPRIVVLVEEQSRRVNKFCLSNIVLMAHSDSPDALAANSRVRL